MSQFEDACRQLGLKQHDETWYGEYLRYWIALKQGESGVLLTMTVDTAFSLEKMKEALSETGWSGEAGLSGNALETQIKIDSGGETTSGPTSVKEIIERVTKTLSIYSGFGVRSICQLCKKNIPGAYYNYNGEVMPVCDGCVENITTQKEEARGATPQSYLSGGFGALLGALVGSVVWILLGMVGFYAAFGGLAIAYASFWGYKKLGGKSNKIAVGIIALCVVIAVVFAELAGLAIEIIKYAKSEGLELTILEVIIFLFGILSESETLGETIRNMLLGLLFAGLGSWSLLRNILAQSKAARVSIEKI